MGVVSITGSDTPASQDTVDAVKAQLVQCGVKLLGKGLLSQTSGNLSTRLPSGGICITPSAVEYDQMEPSDIVVLAPDGSVAQGARPPSSEAPLHCAVYRVPPDLSAIVHTHSPYATTLAVLGRPIPAVHYMIARLKTELVRVAPYATYGTPELATSVRDVFTSPARAVLLANHGAVAGGETLKQAGDAAEAVEILATLYYRALVLGEPNVLSHDQMARVFDKQGQTATPLSTGRRRCRSS